MGSLRDCHILCGIFFSNALLVDYLSVPTWEALNFIFCEERYPFITEIKYTNIMDTLTSLCSLFKSGFPHLYIEIISVSQGNCED